MYSGLRQSSIAAVAMEETERYCTTGEETTGEETETEPLRLMPPTTGPSVWAAKEEGYLRLLYSRAVPKL